jgi:Domain of unknown function (DUF4252)
MYKFIPVAILGAASLAAQQQQSQFQDMIKFDQLAPKASKTVEVNLDGNMLSFVKNFLSDNKKDEAEAKRIIGKLKGIYVRSLEFDKEGEYNEADVESLRKQFSGPGWQKMVDVREKGKNGDNAGVYIRTDGKEMSGLVVLSFEPKEVTIVNIVGVIDPSELRALGGKAGIPNIDIGPLRDMTPRKKTNKNEEDE